MKTLGILFIGIVIISACFGQQSALGNDAQDCYETGLRYYNSKDYSGALKWWSKAANQGHTEAQGQLGFMYYEGQGVPQSYEEALKWFRKAADKEDTDAQRLLGVMYYQGQGVTQDYVEALKWFRKAADKGESIAQRLLGFMYREGQGVLFFTFYGQKRGDFLIIY